ncbi:MAG: acetaldehyde dehydrogenase (acetylating) [Candidatus Omnitrophica bacterium]|nr:acetaldehyde dehydrogenase (acetylating) [Candidatus Omnitrophota bacterium]
MANNKINVAILGTGKIGTDLLIKCLRSPMLRCVLFSGRRLESTGITKAKELGVSVSDQGIDALVKQQKQYDLVFDATSAAAHKVHWSILKSLGKTVIDLTPSHIGRMIIPAVNLKDCHDFQNINLISCGGQGGIPLAWAIAETHKAVEYIEIVNTIAAKSAGAATRVNVDEYIETTERAIVEFTNCLEAKTILIVNPAEPCVNMKTTVSAIVREPDIEALRRKIDWLVPQIQKYVPMYKVVVPPIYTDKRVLITVTIQGRGDYLPVYAGNLDIITCAALAVAEELSLHRTGRL